MNEKPFRPIRAWAVVGKNGKLDAMDIFATDDIVLQKGERMVRIIVSEAPRKKIGTRKA